MFVTCRAGGAVSRGHDVFPLHDPSLDLRSDDAARITTGVEVPDEPDPELMTDFRCWHAVKHGVIASTIDAIRFTRSRARQQREPNRAEPRRTRNDCAHRYETPSAPSIVSSAITCGPARRAEHPSVAPLSLRSPT